MFHTRRWTRADVSWPGIWKRAGRCQLVSVRDVTAGGAFATLETTSINPTVIGLSGTLTTIPIDDTPIFSTEARICWSGYSRTHDMVGFGLAFREVPPAVSCYLQQSSLRQRDKLLVVEDDPMVRRALTIFGRQRGFEVISTAHCIEAEELAREVRPSVVILDICLPDGDGRDLVARLRQPGLVEDGVVIIYSASPGVDGRGCEHLDVDGCIKKPVRLGHLFTLVERATQRRHAYEMPTALSS